jgi:hypothetical protein
LSSDAVTPSLVIAVLVVSLGLAVWSGVLAGLDRLYGKRFLQGMFLLQGVLVAQGAYALYLVGGDSDPREPGAFAAYAVLSVLLVPGSFGLALEEKTRYGTLVLSAACLATAVIEWRMVGTWR